MKIFIQLILLTLVAQDFLAENIRFFSYEDEALMCICAIWACILLIKNNRAYKFLKYEKKAFLLLIIFIGIGLISNLKSELINLDLGILSMGMTLKGFFLYFEFRVIFQSLKINIDILKNISRILKFSMFLLVGCLVINLQIGFLEVRGIRYGIKTYAIGFSHPTELAFFAIISMSLILYYKNVKNIKSGQNSTILLTLILIIASGRSKAIAFIGVFILLFYFVGITKKFKLRYIILSSPVLIYVGLPRIVSELLEGARGALYTTALKIAKDYFPFGTGFGTFGSYISRIHYSSLYFKYGISDFWGLSPSMPLFISDTYWAMIIGETGVIGFIIMCMILILIFIQFIKFNIDYKSKVIVLGLLLYTIIAGIAEPIYSSNKSAALFVCLALFSTLINNKKGEWTNGSRL